MGLFETLPADLQGVLRAVGEEQQHPAGTLLINEGAVESRLYFLVDGSVTVDGSGRAIGLSAGDVVGEMAFLDNRPRTADVRVDADCRVLALDREQTFQALSAQPLLLQTLIEGLLEQQESRLAGEATEDQRSAGDYVDELASEALRHRAVEHPYLAALDAGDLPDMAFALADFAQHYYSYSAHFPRYLTALISRLENPDHREALLANLTEESGEYDQEELDELREFGVDPEWIVGIPHPALFQRFRKALGVANTAVADDHIEVVCWREMLISTLSSATPAEAVGALGLGTETIVQRIYMPFCSAIAHLGKLTPRDSVFFPLHTAVDDHHQAILKSIAADFAASATGRADLAKGMYKALTLRDSVWNWLYQRALDPGKA